ncbi:hypothetical protein [Saccharothrix stipae]
MRARAAVARRRPPRRGPTLRLPFAGHIALWLLLGVTVAASTAWVLWLLLGQPALRPPNAGPATTQDKFDGLKIALTVVGGIGGVIALTVAYRKQRLGEAAERREDTKAFTERFTKASELIGSPQAAVRLAGIHAMAALADDWDDHRQTCIDVLCAYLRMPYDPPATSPPPPPPGNRGLGLRRPRPTSLRTPAPPAAAPPEDPREERQVRHTVIRVIAAHLRPDAPVAWNGRTLDFTGATFDGGNLGGIDVGPGTDLVFRDVTISGGHLDLTDVTISGGGVDFRGAAISGGYIGFGGSTISTGEVDFGDSTISGGEIDFGHVTMSGGRVDLGGMTISGGFVHFAGAEISGGEIVLADATVSGGDVNFMTATVSGGYVDFTDAKLSDGEVTFAYATLSGGRVDFLGAEFSGLRVDFEDAKVSDGVVDIVAEAADRLRLTTPNEPAATGSH